MLPVMNFPRFKAKLPSTGQEIEYRPFLVKEEKVLLMALEGGDQKEIVNAVLEMLSKCVLTEDINVKKLPMFDVEYLFLKVRGKSVGEVIEMMVRHPNSDCQERTQIEVPLEEIKVVGEVRDGKIQLNERVGIKLRYPSFSDTYSPKRTTTELYNLIYECVEMIWDEDEVYSDFSKEDLEEWFGSLNKQQFNMIVEFFNEIPRLSYTISWGCKACGELDTVTLEGLTSFFTLG